MESEAWKKANLIATRGGLRNKIQASQLLALPPVSVGITGQSLSIPNFCGSSHHHFANTVPPLPHHSTTTALGALEVPREKVPSLPSPAPTHLSSKLWLHSHCYPVWSHLPPVLSFKPFLLLCVFCNRIEMASMSVFCPHKLTQLGTHG